MSESELAICISVAGAILQIIVSVAIARFQAKRTVREVMKQTVDEIKKKSAHRVCCLTALTDPNNHEVRR